MKNLLIVLAAALMVALPFVFQEKKEAKTWEPGDPELIVISSHNEAIRFEFDDAFSHWHQEKYGQPVKVQWRVVGGTTEIRRFLESAMIASFRPWWRSEGNRWPASGANAMWNGGDSPEEQSAFDGLRGHDDPTKFTTEIDVFFGGGEYDHGKLSRMGMTVPPWPADQKPTDLLELIPDKIGGETWRTDTLYGNAVSTFGICYNLDRLEELELDPPRHWEDLTDPSYAGFVGVADPTKSGSISKAFEMMVHQQIFESLKSARTGKRDCRKRKERRDA